MSEWLPIETAMRDGTKIDVWARKFTIGDAGRVVVEDVGRIADAYWGREVHIYRNPHERKEGPEGWVVSHGFDDDEPIESGDVRVTHWMPKPDGPKP